MVFLHSNETKTTSICWYIFFLFLYYHQLLISPADQVQLLPVESTVYSTVLQYILEILQVRVPFLDEGPRLFVAHVWTELF